MDLTNRETQSGALSARDVSLPATQQGLFNKFHVHRVDGSDTPGCKHYGCRYFVLDVDHDPHAVAALRAYAASVRATHPLLAADLEAHRVPMGQDTSAASRE